jgi:hypothetical protein
MRHEAVYNLYSNVTRIVEDNSGVLTAYDANDNVVSIDTSTSAFSDKVTELTNAYNIDNLRQERNTKLAETDHWDASDTPDMTQAQIDYRQALRDITDNYSSLDTVVWPTKP